MTTAAIYTRISKYDGNDEHSPGVRRQAKLCEELAARRGWTVATVFEDDDTSAFTGKRRRGFEALLDAVRAREVDAVIAYHADRLYAHPADLERFVEVIEASKAKVATVDSGDMDLSTASGKLIARMLGAAGRHERERTSERIRRQQAEAAAAGRDHGGPCPFGYIRTADGLMVNPTEAPLVVELFERVIRGGRLAVIAADFTERTGKRWWPPKVRKIALAARYAGLRVHGGDVVGPAQWPGIVSEDTWRRAAAILSAPGRGHGKGTARKHLLAGMLSCSKCGTALRSVHGGNNTIGYTCPARSLGGCGGIFVTAAHADDALVEMLLRNFDGVDLPHSDAAPTSPAFEAAEVEARLEELAARYGAGEVTMREWDAARRVLSDRLRALRADLAAAEALRSRASTLAPYRAKPGSLRAAWPDLDLDRRRAILKAALSSCVVKPADRSRVRFDPARLEPVWRF